MDTYFIWKRWTVGKLLMAEQGAVDLRDTMISGISKKLPFTNLPLREPFRTPNPTETDFFRTEVIGLLLQTNEDA